MNTRLKAFCKSLDLFHDPDDVAQEAEAFIEISEFEVTHGTKPGKS
jgi:hypothetical protein